ncbi:MAG: cyclic nucleotide-binding domain-containing protein [Deltaproteobacteria bacterium HGW-Deltaproteobacteria-15]|jgi:CRP-like cAMP-binding protein|nr:MAG: cyclic nucleotide-binding domain-containing protein [Deltaproteobacteria bacterium HGW-Deltaproteobacteria-15]
MPAVDYPSDNKEILDKLRLMPALKRLNEEDLDGVLSLSRIQRFEEGEIIIREGQYDNWIYFLISGKIAIEKKGEAIGVLQERGDIFGEMGIIDGSPRSATIRAVDKSVCFAMDASYIDRLKGNDRVSFQCILYQAFAQILATRLRIADDRFLKVKDANAALEKEIRKLRAEAT